MQAQRQVSLFYVVDAVAYRGLVLVVLCRLWPEPLFGLDQRCTDRVSPHYCVSRPIRSQLFYKLPDNNRKKKKTGQNQRLFNKFFQHCAKKKNENKKFLD